MPSANAARTFAALGHEGRLSIYRLLVDAGPDGLPAGEISRRTAMLQNTCSSSLNILTRAGLIAPRREGRSIVYTAAPAQLGPPLAALLQGLSVGDPARAAALAQRLSAAGGA